MRSAWQDALVKPGNTAAQQVEDLHRDMRRVRDTEADLRLGGNRVGPCFQHQCRPRCFGFIGLNKKAKG